MAQSTVFEPPHDKTNKMTVHPAKTQISLGIHPVWSESLLCAQIVAKDPSFLHADSEDWSDWADAQADLSLCWVHRLFCRFCQEAAHKKHPTHPPPSYIAWNPNIIMDAQTLKVTHPSRSFEPSHEGTYHVIWDQQRCRSACASTQSDQQGWQKTSQYEYWPGRWSILVLTG